MPRYSIAIKGTSHRSLPAEGLSFLDCLYKGLEQESPGRFRVYTSVSAPSEENALQVGREKIKKSSYGLGFFLGFPLWLNTHGTAILQGDIDEPVNELQLQENISASAHTSIYEPTPPTEIEIKSLNNIDTEVKANSWLKRVLRWWAEGTIEPEPIDSFIKLWIALECFLRNKFNITKDGWLEELRATQELECEFGFTRGDVDYLINTLKETRNNLLHGGKVTHDPQSCADETKDYIEKLLTIYFDI